MPRIVATLAVLLADVASGEQLTKAELHQTLAPMLERMAALEKESAASKGRVALLEAENSQLQRRLRSEATARADGLIESGVSPFGGTAHERRQLSSTTCCRWTRDDTCGEILPATRYKMCTGLHEYLEGKTTTYEFADLMNSNCMGTNEAGWNWKFDGPSANVSLYKDATTPVASWPTPLKVTHAANCAEPPVLTVQHQTVHELGVTVNGNLFVGSINVASELARLNQWVTDPNNFATTAYGRFLSYATYPPTHPYATYPNNFVLGPGADARSVWLGLPTMGGSFISGFQPPGPISLVKSNADGCRPEGGCSTVNLQAWYACTHQNGGDGDNYIKCVKLNVWRTHDQGILHLHQAGAGYKDATGLSLATFVIDNWSDMSTGQFSQSVAGNHGDDGYGVDRVEYWMS